jgi:hypothetical protein
LPVTGPSVGYWTYDYDDAPLSWAQRKSVAWNAAVAIAGLHEQGVVHGGKFCPTSTSSSTTCS